MPIHASPGVYFETIDFSLYAPKLAKTILALVGKSTKGPTEPTYVTSVRQYTDLFGTPKIGEYSALSAVSFLEFGSSLWFRRLVGPSATKATVEIPRAYEITDELVATADDTGAYVFNATLNSVPVAGTVELKVVDPTDATNYVIINDDGNGVFSPYTNSAISQYPDFIDYDTGEFRFTLAAGDPSEVVSIRYNYREFSVANENNKTVTLVDAGGVYSGILAHPNIIDADTTFDLHVVVGEHTYTFTTTGVIDPATQTFDLVGKDELDATIGAGTLVITTGEWAVDFNEGTNVELADVFVANYDYSTFKVKTLGTIGAANPDGGKYGLSYIGNLGTVITPSSVSILVDDTAVSVDNGSGRFTGGMATCTNTVNYSTKAISFGLVTPPSDGFEIYASYMAKYSQVIDTIPAEGSESGSVSATMTMAPIIKGSVSVMVKAAELVDDGEGRLIGAGGNGTIDYDLGIINVNYVQTLVEGDTITASYLSKLGDASALYEGSSYDGIKLQFYKDPFSGYGLKVWNASQLTTQNPEENWKDLNFTDVNSVKYFMNKVASNLVELSLYDVDVSAIPLLNSLLTLAGGDDDAANITSTVAATALGDFSNSETYDINLLACPDYPGDKVVANALIQICEVERGDCFAIIDPPQSLTPQQVVNWSNGDGQWANENSLNSSFAALYYPWLQISDTFSESLQWVPPSVRMVSVYAYNDSKAEVWNAPAGLNRGRLFKVQKVERNLNIGDRDLLYATGSNAVNPICDFVGDGIVVFGQKTLQRASTALDRVNVMRMILYITKILATATKYLLFEPNDRLTWIQYTQLVNPLISDIKQRRGLYEFKVVCDETTNTAYDIDNNTMIAEIWMKPTKTAERLINRYVITSNGASFSELESL
jgi:phage tail sheath protein FI